jgi:Tfp pilus assembly protein PilN
MKAVNLIPSEQRAGGGPVTGESEGAAFIVLGLIAGLAVLAGLYGLASHEVSSRKDKVASINAQAQATKARADALAPYTTFKATYQQRQNAVSELVNTRFDWAHAFHELGRVVPADASLVSVKGTIGSATGAPAPAPAPSTSTSASAAASSTVTSATPPGSVPTFILAGCATSQTEVAQTLQRLRLIDGVSGVTLQSSTKSTSGTGSSGGCPPKDPAFAMTVTFVALPTPSATPGAGASTQSAAASSSGSTPTPATPASKNANGAQ